MTGLKTGGRSRTPTLLKQLDVRLAKAKEDLKEATTKRERLVEEASAAVNSLNDAVAALDKFEREHATLLGSDSAKDGSAVQRTIAGYREQIQSLLLRKQKQYERRGRKRKELEGFQKELIAQYSAAEEGFVPVFKRLAHSFLGIDLDIQMETRSGRVSLILSVRGTTRRRMFELSESQRFFVDIALRMALLKFTSSEARNACLLVDTPEGALDIAYEKRAGDMFAQFVTDGFNLIFTANINTSQLLLSLATLCGRSKMQLHRMTSWAKLSDVQRSEEGLFSKAYERISAALKKGPERITRAINA